MVINSDAKSKQNGYPHDSTNGDGVSNGVPSTATAEFPIAIVGMSCRFAGNVTSPSKLWDLCVAGQDGWSPIPESRFDINAWHHEDPQKRGKTNVKGGYFLDEDISLFDAAFFKYSSDNAAAIDPQIRLLLEGVYEATEDAGIPMEKIAGSNTSVFSGCFSKDYFEAQARDPEQVTNSTAGNGTAMLSNRISHFYDLQGASMTIDTGCSASLVALNQACWSIWSGHSDASVVTGADILLNPDSFISMSTLGALSKDGRCFAWDSRANGFGRGEGVAVMIIKPLETALRDGDRVHGVIRGIGLNQDGKTPTISSPSMEAQVKLIHETYKRAGLDIADTGYVEAHMTGTAAGDPIEAEALAQTFGKSRAADDPIYVGSVKTNVGHAEPVSGLAAIIKTCFALREGLIPRNLNYEVPHKNIPLKDWHLQVPTELMKWPVNKSLRASINNFGYGGTNAHVILEGAPAAPKPTNGTTNGIPNGTTNRHATDESRVYLLSARDATVAKAMANDFATHFRGLISEEEEISTGSLAYTLAERRSLFPWMMAVSAKNLEELCDRWESPATKAVNTTLKPVQRLGFVFNGQGAQWYAMGRELILAYPTFGAQIREASEILSEYGAKWSLIDELMRDEKSTRINEVDISQPSTVAIQLCLVDLLKSWGITPAAVTSHSSGEIAAAYTVGALTFKEALGVIFYRGQLAVKLQKNSSVEGGMAAVGLGADGVEKYTTGLKSDGQVTVACINSSSSVTLSGDLEALDEVVARIDAEGIFVRKLKVPLAYHSHHMALISGEYTKCLTAILPEKAKSWDGILFSSPVTGEIVTSADVLSPSHWARNLTSPVLFSEAFESMCFNSDDSSNVDMILEIGAHSTLAGPIRQLLKARGAELPYVSCLKRSVDAVETMQELACDLLCRDYPIDLTSINFPSGLDADAKTFLTDLPTYPWNHSTSHWFEPRISKEMRGKRFPPHELLGTMTVGGTTKTPTWRNFLRLNEVEWLRDHQVESKVIAPGATYIAMAIEATRLLTDPSEETIRGYRLRDIQIMNALVIPESAAVETQITLRQCTDKELDHVGWYQFELTSLGPGDLWVENCKGFVTADIGNVVEAATTQWQAPPTEDTYFATKSASKVREITNESLFSRLQEMGIQHGPVFQNLTDSKATEGKGLTNFVIADVASTTHDYVLHPTTLDSIFQASFCCLPEERARSDLVLPRSIRAMYIPQKFKRQGGDKLQAFTELARLNRQGMTSNISVISTDVHEPKQTFFQMQDFFCQAVPRDTDEDMAEEISLCAKNCWVPDILHAIPEAIEKSLKSSINDVEIDEEKKRIRAAVYLIHDAVKELEEESSEDIDNWVWHHKLFYDWMKATVASADRGELREGSKNWTQTTQGMRQYLYDELEGSSPTDQMLVRIGQNLPAILRGEITTLELMMEGNLLNEHYGDQSASALRVLGHARTLLEIHAMKDPGAKILEIGGGTGGGAKVVLEAFDARARQEGFEGSLVGHYTFTDISQGFFAAARERFSAWEGMMDFKQLDIDEDPTTQGFEEGQYDMIIAGMVLHATKNLHRTLTHVRKLLKPGGKLILLESTKDRLDTQLIFGPLPGWWLAEEADRKMSPNASVEKWDEVLRETGFGGVDFDIFDYEEPEFQSTSTILATAMPIEGLQGPISIVHDASQDPSHPWFKHLCATIEAETGVSPVVECLDVVEVEDKICIVTAELQQPFLDGIDGPSFESLRGLLVNSKGVLWLSSGGLVDSAVPSFAATQGLLRTLRLEDSSKRYVQLDFETASDANEAWSKDKFGHIVHVLQQDFNFSLDKARMETEYSVKDSMLHVSRLIPDKKRNQIASTRDIDPEAELQPYYQTDRPLVWETSGSGMLSDLHFVDKLDLVGDVPSGFIEVESKAMGLNFRDVLVALGQLDEELIGHESGGIITRVGPDTEHSGLRVGDRVSACPVGRFATRALAHWTAVVKIPDDMSFEHAAAVPVTYGTAYHALFHVARIQKGETVLIHAAAGGFGQAAVVLAQYAGAEVFATCSSEYKRDIIHQQYNVPLDHILSSREPSFAPAIMAMTNGQGVDIVLNSLSGAMLKETWDCVARFGRFIEVGKVDLEAARRLDMSPFRRCTTFASVDLMQLREYNRPKTHEALVEGVRISYERGKAPILPITQYSMSDMEKAMRLMQSGKHTGKLLFVPSQEDKVKVISRVRPVSLSDPNATYLIVGGLTGIGYAVAEFLMSKGANHLLLVSRKATKHENAAKLHAQGAEYGCKIHIRDCDLTSESSLVALLKECSSSMPPIRGLINCAMVLDDTVFEHMKYEQWTNGIRSKIDTSRNLDKYLPKDISFFIMLASGLGVAGGSSQGNYAAGNAYQDALSRKRIKQGLASTTLDLCVIRKVGYVENRIAGGDDTIVSRFLKLGFGAVDVAVVLQLIESAIRDPRQSAQEDAQIVMGISEATCIAAANNGIPDRRYNALQMANRRGRDSGAGSASSGASPTAALVRALSAPDTDIAKASALLVDALAVKLAEIFSLDLAEIDVALPLSRYGVDSLVAVELRNWLSGAIRAKVTVFEILQSTSLTEFAGLLAVKSEYVSAAAQEVVAEGAATEEVAK
ncbi:Thiolase-like protein [Glarea lozoyensis ATCC 20868]|uniref:Thiolase-like protein n=1 Tax=Glarea lozoyensis (strain ATCC 20868 / MF5171) TaxID=1116229 RepID=S3CZZ4_GLAL2|nr:Thiolase-like protein [Glarea lozoyensis ATCC 20868]EPE25381.1 Thiolase-like protein [Glarea lozoyensis ATCC 20868]